MLAKLTRFFLTCLIISAANCQEDSTPIVETASSTSGAIFNDATTGRYAGETISTHPGKIPDSPGNDRLGTADDFTAPSSEGESSNSTETVLLRGTSAEMKKSTVVKKANFIGLTTEAIVSTNKDEDALDVLSNDYVYADQDIRFPVFTHSPPILTTTDITTSKPEDLDEYIYGEQLSKEEEIAEEAITLVNNLSSTKESRSNMDNQESDENITRLKGQVEDNIRENVTTLAPSNEESTPVEIITTTPYILRFETIPANEGIEQNTPTTVNDLPSKDESPAVQHNKQSENVTINEKTTSETQSHLAKITPYNLLQTTTIQQKIIDFDSTQNEQDATSSATSLDYTTSSSTLEENRSDFDLEKREETTTFTVSDDSNEGTSLQKRYTADIYSSLATELSPQNTIVDVKTESYYVPTNIPFTLHVEELIITLPPSVFEQINAKRIAFDNEESSSSATTSVDEKLHENFQTDNIIVSTPAPVDNLNKDTIQDLDDVEVFKGDNAVSYENIVLSTTAEANSFSTDFYSATPMTIFSQKEDVTTTIPDLIREDNSTNSIPSTSQLIVTSSFEGSQTTFDTILNNTVTDRSTIGASENNSVTQKDTVFTTFASSVVTETNIPSSSIVNENTDTTPYFTIATEAITNILSTTSSTPIEEPQSTTSNDDYEIPVTQDVITESNNYEGQSTIAAVTVTSPNEEVQSNLYEQFTENISTEKLLHFDANFTTEYETTSSDSNIDTTTTIIDVWLAEQNLTRTTIEEDLLTASTTIVSAKDDSDDILDVTEGNLTTTTLTVPTTEIGEDSEGSIGTTNSDAITPSLSEDQYSTTTDLYENAHQGVDDQIQFVSKTFREGKKLDMQGTSTEYQEASTAVNMESVTTESGAHDLDLNEENLTSTIFSKELVDNGQFTADAINILKESSYETTENVHEDNLESNEGVPDLEVTTPTLESGDSFENASTVVMDTTTDNNFDVSTERIVYTLTMSTKSEEFLNFNHLEEESAKNEQNSTEVTLTTIHAQFFESYQHRNNETIEDDSLPNKEIILLPQDYNWTSTELHEEAQTIGNILIQKESSTTTDNIISSKKELEELDSTYLSNQTSTTSNIFGDTTTTSDNLNVEDNREAFIESKINVPITPAYDEERSVISTKYLDEKATQSTPSEQSGDLLTQKSIMDILRGENVDMEEHSLTDRETKVNLTSLDMQNWQKLSLNELQEVGDNIEGEESEESDDGIKTLEEDLLNGATNGNESHTNPVSTSYFDEDYTNSEEFNSSEAIYHDHQNNTPYLFIVPNKDGCLAGNISLKVFVGEQIMHIPKDALVVNNCLNQTYDLTIAWEDRDLHGVDVNSTISLALKAEETYYFLESVEIKHMDNTEDTKCRKENLTMLATKMGETMLGHAIIDFENGYQLELMDVILSIEENDNPTDTTYTSQAAPVISTMVLVIICTSTTTCLILAIAAIIVYRKVTTKAAVYKMTVE